MILLVFTGSFSQNDKTLRINSLCCLLSNIVLTMTNMINFSNSVIIFMTTIHDDVIKWKYFPCYWPFVLGIHRSPVNSPHKGQ